MFSKKTLEEKIKVMQAALEGKPINFTNKAGINWVCSGENIAFDWTNFDYNIYEEPKTKPSIDWKDVNKEFKYMATDNSGDTYIYLDKPIMDEDHWWADTLCCDSFAFSSFVPGTCDWKDSLVERPD